MPDGVRATSEHHRRRWMLNRAGIMNVYQYDNELIEFADGRLLIRGVNGSGKSTAMNMLLPFLLTARLHRIDAGGEQTGVLKSWMLDGRQEAQPVGYLWIEFAHPDGRHLSCGCGIKANRASDTVTTWWFITGRRPAIDLNLIEGLVPVSAEALRAEIGPDAVFSHGQRSDYRAAVRQQLFGGADLDQHLRLLDTVRNPHVGNQFDRELPEHLTRALPNLSERALEEAARPLEDLDEHRRNVSALAATSATLESLCDSYQNYLLTALATWQTGSQARLADVADTRRDTTRLRNEANKAAMREQQLEAEISSLENEDQRLIEEITALKDSPAYKSGVELEDLRVNVRSLIDRVTEAQGRTQELRDRLPDAESKIRRAQQVADSDHRKLSAELADAVGRADAGGLTNTALPLGPIAIVAVDAGPTPQSVPLFAPKAGGQVVDRLPHHLQATEAAAAVRQQEVGQIRRLNAELIELENAMDLAAHKAAGCRTQWEAAKKRFEGVRADLTAAVATWNQRVVTWARKAEDLTRRQPIDAEAIRALARSSDDRPNLSFSSDVGADTVEASVRERLRTEIGQLVTALQRSAAVAEQDVAVAKTLLDTEEQRLAELNERTEPDAPLLTWQQRNGPCLADLVDFVPDLPENQRAGLEAGLEASGLLSATVGQGGLEMANGDLVVVPGTQARSPLSSIVRITVPPNALDAGVDIDVGLLQKVLDSIAVVHEPRPSDPNSGEPGALVTTDGCFRLGTLTGRHQKPVAEYIGATARRARLERQRADAKAHRDEAWTAHRAAADNLAQCRVQQGEAEAHADSLPTLTEIDGLRAGAAGAEEALDGARVELREAEQASTDAGIAHLAQVDLRDRAAATAQLPTTAEALDKVAQSLIDLANHTGVAHELTTALDRALDQWIEAVGRLEQTVTDLASRRAEEAQISAEREKQASRLASLEDSLGLPFQEVTAAIEVSESDRALITARLPNARNERTDQGKLAAAAGASADNAAERQQETDRRAISHLHRFQQALEVPGVCPLVDPEGTLDDREVEDSADGLSQLVVMVNEIILTSPIRQATSSVTTADGVRSSILQRRESLGAGWDAEARHPDAELPIEVVVDGPAGRMPLANARIEVESLLAQRSGLLTAQQDSALRDLLQGLVAREVAEKLDRANRLVAAMNQHLVDRTIAHDIGVELRWRRRPEIDGMSARAVDLMAKLPDLRTEDEEAELRDLLSVRLDEARRLDPERPYRDLIAEILDYRQWFEMTVLLRRGSEPPKRLTRKLSTTLSVGEKKLVTYLPFLAAVAVSSDGLIDYAADAPRFVLLDDAAATVSEDNHPELLGLPVNLDLDFIMTSERLWGTFATVPTLSIVEVIRDADLGAILLERAHWDGAILARELR